MRTIHFGFRLHEPYQLKKFVEGEEYFSAENFQKADAEIYQPFFALLERNTQRYKQLHFSLMISGTWLDLAERYNPELIRRLKKLVELKQVELIAEPYDHSLAVFYSMDELAEQIRLYQEKIRGLFGVEGRILALPELIYNDEIAAWAEKAGFAGMLAAGRKAALGWHSPNHVYEARGTEYLRVLFQNEHLAKLVTGKSLEILGEKKFEQDGKIEHKMVLSAKQFQKLVDLDCLRGNLVNLYFDARIFRDLREVGVVAFFDELIANWLEVAGNRLAGAVEACTLETPTMELKVEQVVGQCGEDEKIPEEKSQAKIKLKKTAEKGQADAEQGQTPKDKPAPKPEKSRLTLVKAHEIKVPAWLDAQPQHEMAETLYKMRREILASEDEKLIRDFRRLSAADYQIAMDEGGLENWRKILADLKRRSDEAKKSQAVEISRAWTKKHDRGEISPAVEDEVETEGMVQVQFGPRVTELGGDQPEELEVEAKLEADPMAVPVRRLPKLDAGEEGLVEPPKVTANPGTKKPKKRGMRRIVKRIVLE